MPDMPTLTPAQAELKAKYRYLTRDEAALYLRVHVATIDRWRGAGRLVALRFEGVGNRVLFDINDLDALLVPENQEGETLPFSES